MPNPYLAESTANPYLEEAQSNPYLETPAPPPRSASRGTPIHVGRENPELGLYTERVPRLDLRSVGIQPARAPDFTPEELAGAESLDGLDLETIPPGIGPGGLTLGQRIRRSGPVTRLLGPPAIEREARVEPGVYPHDLAVQAVRATQLPPVLAEPARELVGAVAGQLPAPAAGVVRGVGEAALSYPLAMPALGPVAGRVVAGGFAADMASQIPELKDQFDQAVREGDTEKAWELGTGGVLTPLMAAGAATHAASRPATPAQGVARELRREAQAAELPTQLPPAEPQTFTVETIDQPAGRVAVDPMGALLERTRNVREARTAMEFGPGAGAVRVLNGAGQIIDVVERGAVREDAGGGQVSFAAEAPTLLREALGPRTDPDVEVARRIADVREAVEPPAEPARPGDAIEPTSTRAEQPSQPGGAPATTAEPAPVVKPGIVSGTAAEAWADRTIREGPQRLTAGLDPELLAAYVVKGAAHLERGARQFAAWSQKMIAEFGDAVRPHLRTIFEQAQRVQRNVNPLTPTLSPGGGEGGRQSKFAARAAVAPQVLTPHQKRMAGEAGLYETQAMDDVTQLVQGLSNDALRAIPALTEAGPNNVWVAAKLELYNRLKNANSEEAWSHLDEARQQLTTFGQLVNQAKLLTSATPEGIVATIEHGRRRGNLPPLQPADKGELVILADRTIETQRDVDRAERDYRRQPTDENLNRLEDNRRQADTAQRQLEGKKQTTEPRSMTDTLVQLMQGNVLTPLSQASNIAGNLMNAFARAGERSGALAADLFWSFVRQRPREIYVNPLRTMPRQLEAMKRSWADMKRIWREGSSELDPSKLDTHRTLHPLLALRELKTRKWLNQPLGESAALALEASPFAMHAAAQLRTLGAFDLPTRSAARARLITEAMQLRRINAKSDLQRLLKQPQDLATRVRIAGLRRFLGSQDATRHAVRVPERFFTPEELARVDLESRRVTFQEPNPVAGWLLSGARRTPAALRLFLRANALFVTTPLNIIKQVYQFNPAIAGAAFLRHAAKGQSREAKLAFGRLLTGSILAGTGYVLARSGLLSPPMDDPSEAQKGRMLSQSTVPPNHVNLSGIQRAAVGQDPTWRAGDRTLDVSKLGVMGILMMQAAHVARQQERNPEAAGPLAFAGDLLTESSLGAAQYGLQQSFLRNMESVLNAVSSGQDNALDAWAQSFTETALSVPFPNTLTTFSRASRQWRPEVRGDSWDQRLNNLVKNRLDFAMPGPANLPLRRGLWGEPLPETPEGALPFLHQFLDTFKSRTVPEDPVALALYTLWRRTGEAAVIPTPPDRRLVVDQQAYTLTREQHSRLQELVGKARREIADDVVTTPDFLKLTPQEQIDELRDLWRHGEEMGKTQFLEERQAELTRKPARAGLPSR